MLYTVMTRKAAAKDCSKQEKRQQNPASKNQNCKQRQRPASGQKTNNQKEKHLEEAYKLSHYKMLDNLGIDYSETVRRQAAYNNQEKDIEKNGGGSFEEIASYSTSSSEDDYENDLDINLLSDDEDVISLIGKPKQPKRQRNSYQKGQQNDPRDYVSKKYSL